MEKKGIKTERGNRNRIIIAINKEFKKLKAELKEAEEFFISLWGKVKSAMGKYSSEKQEEYHLSPDLFDVYSYIETYYRIQKELSKKLSYNNRARKEHFDSNKHMHTLAYMRNNNLKTILDIQLKKDEVTTKLKDNKDKISNCNKAIKNIDTLLKQAKIIKENKMVYDKYKGADNSIFSKIAGASKEEYYHSHKEEIDKYKRAKAIVKNLTGSEKIEIKKWEKIKSDLQTEISHLSFYQKDIKKEVIGGGLNINISRDFSGFKEKYNLKNSYILYAGRKDKGKNIDLLVEYFKKFKERNNDNLDLVLIGGGQLEIPKGIKNCVHDLGFIDIEDKYKAYANAVTLVQPSVNESFSIVIMESWLTERPVIVNNNCEVTKNFAIESNGGLYFNNYFEFEEILKFYINNPNIANKMGQNGKEYVFKNFDREIVTKKYIDFFKELVGEKD